VLTSPRAHSWNLAGTWAESLGFFSGFFGGSGTWNLAELRTRSATGKHVPGLWNVPLKRGRFFPFRGARNLIRFRRRFRRFQYVGGEQ